MITETINLCIFKKGEREMQTPTIVKESSAGYSVFTLETELLQSRNIFLTDAITSESCGDIIKQIFCLEKENTKEPINIYINSPGGSVQDGLALYDVLTMISSPVYTYCIGQCASMGAIIFLAGVRRLMLPHSKIMIHDPAWGNHNVAGKKPHELQAELDDLNKCRKVLAQIIADRTNHSLNDIYDVTASDTYYNADEAVEFRLATNVINKFGAVSTERVNYEN
jgi:ATP-dependent Clp protease protease subunit